MLFRSQSKNILRALAVLMIIVLSAACLSGCGASKPKETPQTPSANAVVVSTAQEFLDAIAPDTEIFLKAGKYNLTEAVDEIPEIDAWDEDHPYVSFEYQTTGFQVNIYDCDNLYITGEGTTLVELLSTDTYADVLNFEYCEAVFLDHMTMGHTETGNCAGEVLEFNDCWNIGLDALDLYGCGTYGISTWHVVGLTMTNSVIRDCSYGIMSVLYSANLNFSGCEFRNCRGYEMLDAYRSEMSFEECKFDGNESESGFITEQGCNSFYFRGCEFGKWESASLNDFYNAGTVVYDEKCKFAAEMNIKPVIADSAEKLLDSITSNCMIIVEPGYYNLSEYMEKADIEVFNGSHSYIQLNDVYDGVAAYLYGTCMSITGRTDDPADVTLVIDPRYASVFSCDNASGISFRGMTMGHTDLGECSGAVVDTYGGSDYVFANMDLFGCGTEGISSIETSDIHVTGSDIHDCAYASVYMDSMYGIISFVDSTLDGGGFGKFGCEDADFTFRSCKFGQEESNALYFDDSIDAEYCIWEEPTYYPDYEGGYGDFRDDVMMMDADEDSLEDTWFAVLYSGYSEDEGAFELDMPAYDDSTGNMFQITLFIEDGGECTMDQYGEEPVSFGWSVTDGEGQLTDDGTAFAWMYLYIDPYSENGDKYLVVDMEDATIWFRPLDDISVG